MELKNFKKGDIISQKNDMGVRWTVDNIDLEKNIVSLRRKGGAFNEMESKFNGDNQNFEPAGRTEKRIIKEEKIKARKEKEESFQQNRFSLNSVINNQSQEMQTIVNTNKMLKPSDVASLVGCKSKDVLDAIHDGSLNAETSGKKTGRGVRYLVKLSDAENWKQSLDKTPIKEMLTTQEIVQYSQKSEAEVRKAISNGQLLVEDANANGKVPRYQATKKSVDQWLSNKKDNPFDVGSRLYGYYQVFLQNDNQATYKQLIDGCQQYLKSINEPTDVDTLKKDLNNKINAWKKGNMGLKIKLDKSHCKTGKNGRVARGELDNIVIVVEEIV